jgi:hypothetical protein
MLNNRRLRLVGALIGAASFTCLIAGSAEPTAAADALDRYRQQRAQAAQRTRRIIFNNDGDDHLLPRGAASFDAFFAERTTALLGSQVDTIFYCTSRPFGMLLHNTKVGDVLADRTAIDPDRINIVADLLAQGTDPLRLMVDYCHRQKLEVFWSMRMNDTHDTPHTPAQPHYYFSTFKKQHPEFLFGSPGKPPQYGTWTAVDFAQPEVREFLFRMVEEVCRDFDVDGLELDFFRHLVLFRTVANGAPASAAEREMLTAFVRRVRAMTETEGLRRGRPLLLTVRTPDSLGYCQGMGVDLERWLAEGLLDIWVAGGDFLLNRWDYSTALGARYHVPVYCDLDPSIPYGLSKRFDRNSLEAYRGRAMEAWAAGAAGIYIFNCFDPKLPLWRSLGDPADMLGKKKYYFVNALGRSGYLRASRALPGGDQYDRLPTLHPVTPMPLAPGAALDLDLPVAEDIAAAQAAGLQPRITCYVFAGLNAVPQLILNGTRVEGARDDGSWFAYPVRPDLLRRGANQVRLSRGAEPESSGQWDADWTCDVQPPMPWSRDDPRVGTEARMQDKALLIADRSLERGSYLYYVYPWNAAPATRSVVEVRARVISGRNGIIVCNGVAEEDVQLHADRIEAAHAGLSYPLDTTAAFHDYRVEIENSDIRVYVDGKLAIDGAGKYTSPASDGRNDVLFGASSSPSTGEALWERLRFRTGTASVHDLVLVVDYP